MKRHGRHVPSQCPKQKNFVVADSYLVVADTLSSNRSTARGIVACFIRENRVHETQRGGRNIINVNEEMKSASKKFLARILC